jgi:signal transduction histidine kinase
MALVVVLAIMFVIGGLGVGYVARYATRPLREAADSVSSRQGWDTSPVPYRGPADELGRIVTEFNHLLGEIDQVHEREKVFLAEISHELRTPLTGLYGHLERLVRHYPEEAGMAGAMRSARHLKRLVEDLLLLEHGDLERRLDLRIVNLAEPLRSVAQDFPGLGLELSSGPIEVLGDPDRIQQLVRNITQNAIRATGSPKLVTIRLGRQDQEALIEIEDCGPGIEPELQAKIFDRFVHASKDGHGLGLAIAKQIADAHHGQINFTSVPGQTVFRITLPLLEMDSEDDEESRTQAGHE